MTGTIMRAVAGFYYVAEKDKPDIQYECKARGVFRKKGITPLVGDEVIFEYDELHETGFVTEILPRKNSFERPPLANADLMLIVMAAAHPAPSFEILDRFLLTAEQKNISCAVCVNKCDTADEEKLKGFEIYKNIYPVYFVSAKTKEGVDDIKRASQGKKTALAGPSGVGKSSLTNVLLGRDEMEVGEISQKSKRGKNTTRHTELFTSEGFMIFDTPGFTSFDPLLCEEDELDKYFPEFRDHLGKCRFDNCRHLNEPDCAVREAVDRGIIPQRRYDSYKNLFQLIRESKRY